MKKRKKNNLNLIKNGIINDLIQKNICIYIFKKLIDKISIQIGKIGHLDKLYEKVIK